MIRVRRFLHWTGAAVLAAALLAALAGAGHQRWREHRIVEEFSPPGRFVPVGGYSLHLWCRGAGSPTVVIDPGGYGGTALYAADLVAALEGHTRVCAFDPPGQGWSEAGPDPGAIPERSRAFRLLIANSGIEGPLVLVAESSGAHVARLFTAAHPSRVRALVLVDPSFDDLDRQRRQWSSEERQRAARLRKLAHIVPALSQVGLHRPLLGPRIADALETYPEELRSLVREQLLSRKSVAVLVQRALDREAGLAAVREASLPRRLPLVVLTAEIRDPQDPTPYETEKLAYHRELSERSERGRHVVLADTPHAVIGDRPRRVAEAVLAMIEAAPEESREALRLAGESVPSEGRTQTWGWPKAPKPMSRAENVGTSVLFLSARWTATEVAGTLFGVLLLVGLAGSQLHGMIVGDLPANDFFVGLTGVFALFGWALLHSHSRLVRIELTADAEAVSRPRISAGRRTGSLRPGYLDRRRGDAARRDAPPTTRERS